jgi:hypothetical protein
VSLGAVVSKWFYDNVAAPTASKHSRTGGAESSASTGWPIPIDNATSHPWTIPERWPTRYNRSSGHGEIEYGGVPVFAKTLSYNVFQLALSFSAHIVLAASEPAVTLIAVAT